MTVNDGQQGIFKIDSTKNAVRRLLCLKQAISKATKAISFGPDIPIGTPGGNGAQVVSLQHGQLSQCR